MGSVSSAETGWFKSSHSSDSVACVQVKFEPGRVLIRDSKYRGRASERPMLDCSPADWAALTAGIRAGEFDRA
ncbi:protein of unknown function [Nocardia amikacinitolerans]|uniref:DUF397 domain-containing protein n=1 Tax=Nocardia amikacinitolerans TaxID=756689 RepID=A0A285LBI3_9NOCA|nr:DUF397 domain-containing protein [Nocardia amikacinitolerans]MCP2298876.1 protein of unknown function (DUF397) [Nocardia amikacinitolerans]SNY81387.1 protein of unknown function [Nocardia amikacinitolerans]